MKKLRIEELAVEVFVTTAVPAERGTVRARGASEPFVCASGEWTCLDSCQDTCGMSCNGSCWQNCDCA